jgi:hypothetical protein
MSSGGRIVQSTIGGMIDATKNPKMIINISFGFMKNIYICLISLRIYFSQTKSLLRPPHWNGAQSNRALRQVPIEADEGIAALGFGQVQSVGKIQTLFDPLQREVY